MALGRRNRPRGWPEITTTVMITDVSALLKYHLRMFPASSTCLNASREKLDENQLTGIAMVSLSGLSAVSTAQASGTSQRIASTSNTPKARPLAIVLRQWEPVGAFRVRGGAAPASIRRSPLDGWPPRTELQTLPG